ncbi:hypothetical protein Tco_0975435 [Tanacetum coccineum]|uniref:Uncharacterized protein n=1 Tax=Tanacetum coccineum TaxID=301880 RepID=A0ABQ5EEC1_9ASTR
MFIEQSHDEVYGCLKGGSRNSEGKRLAISMVEDAWLSEKEEVERMFRRRERMFSSKKKNVLSKRKNVFVEEKECIVEEKECLRRTEKDVFIEEKRRAF